MIGTVYALSHSASFERHLAGVISEPKIIHLVHSIEDLPGSVGGGGQIVLIHSASFPVDLSGLVSQLSKRPGYLLGIAADRPQLNEMLLLTQYGIRAYFNSYMADTHYLHMQRLLAANQTWFTPELLARALELARCSVDSTPGDNILAQLTARQREIALAVAQGMSNKRISSAYGITVRTVKTHLTQIFSTLELDDRVALAIKLSGYPQQITEDA